MAAPAKASSATPSSANAASATRHRKPATAIPVSRRCCERVVTSQANQRCSPSRVPGLNAGGLATVAKRVVSPYQTAATTKAAAPRKATRSAATAGLGAAIQARVGLDISTIGLHRFNSRETDSQLAQKILTITT